MHDIEPYHLWREHYVAEEDKRSPYYGKEYSEFEFSNAIYNFYIHPQWDDFGSTTLYLKVIYADYETGFAVIELIGEWNDCLYNDIMFLKENLLDSQLSEGISKFMVVCENVLNFHASDDCYYEEWYEESADSKGWICFVNLLKHVEVEMYKNNLNAYVHFINDINWRSHKPQTLEVLLENLMRSTPMELN